VFDFAMSPHGDWVIARNGDFALVVDQHVFAQEIITRLKVPRGKWIYGDTSFGSNLTVLLSYTTDRALEEATAYIREALDEITQIEVVEIVPAISTEGETALEVKIAYRFAKPDTDTLIDTVMFEHILGPIG
jgi:hypothetical protein